MFVCVLIEMRLQGLDNAERMHAVCIRSLGSASTFGCAGAGHSWGTSRCHDS